MSFYSSLYVFLCGPCTYTMHQDFNTILLRPLALAAFFLIPSMLWAQQKSVEKRIQSMRAERLEIAEGEYMLRGDWSTSVAYRHFSERILTVQVNVSDSGNILGDAANEPSIAIDLTNPSRMAIGWRQFNTITSNFRQAGYAYTTNGGFNWRFPGVIQPGVFRSDPVLDSDAEGNFYYNSLTSSGFDFWCHVFKSTDGGATWDTGTYAFGGDKQWMAIDRTAGIGRGNIYAHWTSSWSICPPGFFTRSVNRGGTFGSCVVIPGDPFWGTVAVGPDGELYVCGWGDTSFVVAKSTSARDSSMAVSWDFVRPVSLDGEILAFAGYSSPNPSGLLGQAWVAVDHSPGPTRGYVYLLCSVGRYSLSDPLDVMFSRSTDGGMTWSVPVRVNDDLSTTSWQWFGTMSVAPNGRIDVVWLDTRDNPGTVHSSLYYSNSTDAGITWSTNLRVSGSFNPHVGWPQQDKMGDYFDMVSDDEGVHLAWAATFNGEQDVYYSRITAVTGIAGSNESLPRGFALLQSYPNPFNPHATIKFEVPVVSNVLLKVYNVLGGEVATLTDGIRQPGTFEVVWDATGVPAGVYFYRLTGEELSHGGRKQLLTRKLILLK